MGDPMTNGEMPSSQFISHLTSYPLIADSITTFKKNSYGQKSLELTDAAYETFAKPVLPYFSTPYQYVAPYVAKVDSLGEAGLSKVDETFPVVKEDTNKLKSGVFDILGYPFKFAGETKDYVFGTYGSEYKKCGGDGYVAGAKAVISSSLVIASDSLNWASSFLSAKKQEAKEVYAKKTSS